MKWIRFLPRAICITGAAGLLAAAGASGIRVAEKPLTAQQTDRLMAFGQLWGFIKFSHPWLVYRGAEWDEALVQAVPAIIAASSADEYRAAVEGMLLQLNDQITRVLPPVSKPATKPLIGSFEIEFQSDAAVVRWGDWVDGFESAAISKLKAALPQIAEAKAVIFDLRGVRWTGDVEYVCGESGLTALLVNEVMPVPARRVRLLRGYPPDVGLTTGGYFSGLVSIENQHFTPKPGAKNIPCVFIVTGAVPPLALALQSAGRGAIVSLGRDSEEFVTTTHDQKLADDLVVRTRLDELIRADGRAGFTPDAIVADWSSGVAAAHQWLNEPASRQFVRVQTPIASTAATHWAADAPLPAMPYRMLAAFRTWSVIEYFFPYKDLMNGNWTDSVRAALPGLFNAGTPVEYHLAVMRLMAQLNDNHVFISSEVMRDIIGRSVPPFRLRMIDGVPVVVGILKEPEMSESRVRIGEELVEMAGQPWRVRYNEIARNFSASTPQALEFKVLNWLLAGESHSTVLIKLRDSNGVERDLSVTRDVSYDNLIVYSGKWGPQTTDVFRLLQPDIGYVDLTRLAMADVDTMLDRLSTTRALVFDMRGYPRGMLAPLWKRLVDGAAVPSALMDPPVFAPGLNPSERSNPPMTTSALRDGKLSYSSILHLKPPAPKPRYTGRTVVLIDERTISLAEYTGQALRASAGSIFVGSPTSGACGDVTWLAVPGGITMSFTGQGWRWPDGKQLQRVGLIPDIPVRSSRAGLAAGRDEPLDAALAYLNSDAR